MKKRPALKVITDLFKDAEQHGFKIVPLTFKHAATGTTLKRKGYSLRWATGQQVREQIILEPRSNTSPDKWFIYGPFISRYSKSFRSSMYARNLYHVARILKSELHFS